MQNDDIEAGLKSLSPLASRVDPLAAAYAAGQRSSDRALNQWRGLTVLAVVAAMVPWMMPLQRPPAITSPQVVIASQPQPSVQHIEAVSPGNVWQLQAAVLEKGLDGLPSTPIAPWRAVRGFDTF